MLSSIRFVVPFAIQITRRAQVIIVIMLAIVIACALVLPPAHIVSYSVESGKKR